jgi:hypothetical protein
MESRDTPQNVMLNAEIVLASQNTPQNEVLNALRLSPLEEEMNVMRSALHSEGCSAYMT